MEISGFEASKRALLQELAAGHDLSPKGSIDVPIRPLVDFINSIDGLVTTSSCSGRISVFRNDTSPGSKGINWLLVRHCPVSVQEVLPFAGTIATQTAPSAGYAVKEGVMTMAKCEGFIMHVHCRDLDMAKDLQSNLPPNAFIHLPPLPSLPYTILAIFTYRTRYAYIHPTGLSFSCGFRESGIACSQRKILVAIRTTAFGMELPLSSGNTSLLSADALPVIVHEMNTRLRANFSRVDKLLTLLKEFYQWPTFRIEGVTDQGQHKLERWGHLAAVTSSTIKNKGEQKSICIFGGYGTDKERSHGNKCQRNLPCIILSENLEVQCSSTLHCVDRVHAAGHTFHCQYTSTSNFIITGGRRSPQEGVRQFLQEYILTEGELHLIDTIEQGDAPTPRWGHTLTEIGEQIFFLFGGRNEEQIFGDGFILRKISSNMWQWEKVFQFKNGDEVLKPCFFHAACHVSGHVVGDESTDEVPRIGVLMHGGCLSLGEPFISQRFFILYPLEHTWHLCSDLSVSCYRFGHTLTNLGFKTILLVGGAAADIDNNRESPLLILDFQMDSIGCIDIKLRKNVYNVGILPCSSCRAHHQALLGPEKRSLYLLGGGSAVLGFGTHHCASAILKIMHGKCNLTTSRPNNRLMKSPKSTSNKAFQETDDVSPLQVILNMITGSSPVKDALTIIVDKKKVKKVKNFLENENFLDKSVRIRKRDLGVQVEAVMRMEGSSIDLDKVVSDEMAIPIKEGFREKLISNLLEHPFWQVLEVNHILFSIQSCVKSKAESVSKYTFVSAFIESFCNKWGRFRDDMRRKGGMIPTTGAKLRLEVVGDIMVIPEDVFCIPPWNGEEGDEHHEMLSELWIGLATCFGVKKVARKAKVDSGMKRESKVRLILPPLGLPADTGLGSPGWTTIVENGIAFSFDITRVMFCSGNCTERMRVGTFKDVRGECIVDLYAGVGYYTLPYLVHAGAAVVHACEWNDNSVLALRHNLRKAGVDSDRCVIYHGDNRNEDTQCALADIADRISLGLLPSSVVGWPLAVNALKSNGGKLHVHENVHNLEITTWAEDTCKKFQNMFFEMRGINMNVHCEHIEKVKSYAPKISHIVADLVCSPVQF